MNSSLIERKISVQFSLASDTFDAGGNTIQVDGLRCQATVVVTGGKWGPAVEQLQMRISGMLNSDMAKLSTLGFDKGVYKKNAIAVYAGDDQSGMSLIFKGGIVLGNVDYNSMPDVGLDISASQYAEDQYASIAANSFKGDVSVSSVVESIATSAGKQFKNNGVTAILSNPAVGGTAIDQIRSICAAANVHWRLRDGTYYIWPAGGSIDDTTIDVGSDTGMVGYPRYQMNGLTVTSVFNPAIEPGRYVKVTSSIPAPSKNNAIEQLGVVVPGANGTFYCGWITHNLTSQTPGGPWFTEMNLYTTDAIISN